MSRQLYGLVGHPLGHSFSQKFFREKFAAEGIDADYLNFDIEDVGRLRELIAANPELRGLNVTIPYKQAVMPLLDDIDAAARAIGAVNVVRVEREGNGFTLHGYNSDFEGFGDALDSFHLNPGTDKALILGTGGASLAVCQALRMRSVEFDSVSRSADKATFTYDQLARTPEIVTEHRIIVNCTPLGTYPNNDTSPEIPYQALTPAHIALDLVYNPAVTLFMRRCADRGCAVKSGLNMLIAQAQASWRLWHA